MDYEKFVVLAKRFARGFVAGGLASVVSMIQAGIVINTIEDLRPIGYAMATAFITGGILAIEKLSRWQDEPQS